MSERPPSTRNLDPPFRGQARSKGFQRVSHGLHLVEASGLTEKQVFVRELEAWLLVLPDGARFTHLTAARLRGWQVPPLPEGVPVFASVTGDVSRPRRPGLLCSRLVTEPEEQLAQGLPVDSPEEILLRAARDLGHLDLRVMIDSALKRGDLDPERMRIVLESGRPGVRPLRAAWNAARPEVESAGETLLEAFHTAVDVPVTPQYRTHDDRGNLLGIADFRVTGTDFLHEYDGAVHRAKKQHRVDLRRSRGLQRSRWRRQGFTLDDLIQHPLVTMHEVDEALGRPHRLVRYRRWRRMVEQSLYSDVGRERLLNRWHRQMGVHDWSRKA